MARQNSLLNWLLPNSRSRTSVSTPSQMFYVGGHSTRTGEVITPENSLKNPTVFACVSFLAQTIAQLPWTVSEKGVTGYNPIKHPIQALLERPNGGMGEFEFKHQIVVDLLTYGNCYILKVVTVSGKVIELIPLHADEMTPILSASGKRSYKHSNGTVYSADKIIHIRDFIGGTVDGLSKVKQCANLVAIDNAIDNAMADQFRNASAVSGVVSFVQEMPPEAKRAFSEQWNAQFGGKGTARGAVAVLDNGATFTQVETISPADADMLNLKQQTMTRIAAIFRVPSYAIEIADGSKYDNLSQRQSGFYRDSIAPLTKNIQQKMTDGLLEDQTLEIEFDSSEIVKGDMQTATAVAVQAVQAGLLTVNEGRDLIGYAETDILPQIPEKLPLAQPTVPPLNSKKGEAA
jgi:HK97 family phage portal protein